MNDLRDVAAALCAEFGIEEEHRDDVWRFCLEAQRDYQINRADLGRDHQFVDDAAKLAQQLSAAAAALNSLADRLGAEMAGPWPGIDGDIDAWRERSEAHAAHIRETASQMMAIKTLAELKRTRRQTRPADPAYAAATVLAALWGRVLGRSYHQNQNTWYRDKDKGPTGNGGGRFIWVAMRNIGVAKEDLRKLNTVLQRFDQNGDQKPEWTNRDKA